MLRALFNIQNTRAHKTSFRYQKEKKLNGSSGNYDYRFSHLPSSSKQLISFFTKLNPVSFYREKTLFEDM